MSYKYLSKSISNIKEGHWGGGWVYKSTGDLAATKEKYDRYGEVSEPRASSRNIVVDKNNPRSMLVQCTAGQHQAGQRESGAGAVGAEPKGFCELSDC